MAKKDITKHKKNEVIYDAKIDGEDSNTCILYTSFVVLTKYMNIK